LNKGLFGDLEQRRRGQSSIIFKSNPVVGRVPLLKLFNVITGSNDYFKVKNTRSLATTVAYSLNLETSYKRVSFRKNMRTYMHHGNPESTLILSMLSVIGIQGMFKETVSQGIVLHRGVYSRPAPQNVLLNNSVDVFVLAMIDPKDISKINLNGEGNFIEFDSSLITLYLSEDKYKNPDFLDNNYNKTVARHLRNEVKAFTIKYGIKTEVVPDTILKLYYNNPHSTETNSIFEIMKIDEQIKNKVFETVSENLMERIE